MPVDAVKSERPARYAHHITLENLLIRGHGNNQQTVGISTKCPAWNWVIRHNTIIGAGTGMYLGDSDGSAPFVAGVIEQNLIVDTIGYNLQIKHQRPRPDVAGMPFDASDDRHPAQRLRQPRWRLAGGAASERAGRPLSAGRRGRRRPLRDLRQLLLSEPVRGAVPGRGQRRALRQPLRQSRRRRDPHPAAQRCPEAHRHRVQHRARRTRRNFGRGERAVDFVRANGGRKRRLRGPSHRRAAQRPTISPARTRTRIAIWPGHSRRPARSTSIHARAGRIRCSRTRRIRRHLPDWDRDFNGRPRKSGGDRRLRRSAARTRGRFRRSR